MQQISSKSQFFSKRVFPIIWFGFLGFMMYQAVAWGAFKADPMSLIMPCAMAVFGFFLMKKLVWDLMDTVYDCGDYLLVIKRGEEDKLLLSNIMNVSASTHTNPPRITLRLVRPGKFGAEIAFSPATRFTLNPFAKNAVAENLMARVDQARLTRER
jgi:hypothetical protein